MTTLSYILITRGGMSGTRPEPNAFVTNGHIELINADSTLVWRHIWMNERFQMTVILIWTP